MLHVIAEGKKNGENLIAEIREEGGGFKYLFNSTENGEFEDEIKDSAKRVSIGGTYYPETQELRIYAAISGRFFDRNPKIIRADGIEETIPCEDGMVY